MPDTTFVRMQPVGAGAPSVDHLELTPTTSIALARQAGARPGEVEAGEPVARQLEIIERLRPRVLEEVSRRLRIAVPTERNTRTLGAPGDKIRLGLDDGGEIYASPAELIRHDSGTGSYINLLNVDRSSSMGFIPLAWFWARVDRATSAGLYMVEVHVGGSGETLTVQIGGSGEKTTGTATRSGSTFRYVCEIGASDWVTVQIGPGIDTSYVQIICVDITKMS